MNEEQLYDLIGRMNEKNNSHSSENSISFKAHREAEKLNDPLILPILIKIIKDNLSNNQKNIRSSAYYIMGKILKHSFDKSACEFLISSLAFEKDKYILSSILYGIADLKLPKDIDISLIVNCSKNEKWQIRHSAIFALRSSENPLAKKALYFYLNQDDEKKYEYEIIYSIASLGKIGNISDIKVLEKFLHSKKRDIKTSAEFAINTIKENMTI